MHCEAGTRLACQAFSKGKIGCQREELEPIFHVRLLEKSNCAKMAALIIGKVLIGQKMGEKLLD